MRILHPHTALRGRGVAAFACVLLAMLCAPVSALDPQAAFNHYRLDHWGVDEGLPQISVLSITQGRLGYLWVGTQNGIGRFDGNHFSKYDRATTGVDTTLAACALATADGLIWFGTPRGVLNISGETVTAIDAGDSLIEVVALAQTAQGDLLAASASGVHSVERGRLVAVPELHDPAHSLLRDGDDVWIGGTGAITRLRARIPERITLPDRTLKILHIARGGDVLWLGTQSGLRRYDPRTGALDTVAEPGAGAIESLLIDRGGNLWVSTLEHLMRAVRMDVGKPCRPAICSRIRGSTPCSRTAKAACGLAVATRVWSGCATARSRALAIAKAWPIRSCGVYCALRTDAC